MDIEGVELSSPDRIVYQTPKITKRALAEYYVAVAPWMLPHAARRPLSLVRCPEGQSQKCFYQKNWIHSVPEGLRRVSVDEVSGGVGQYVQLMNVRGLVALVQYGVMEIHLWGSRVDKIESPDRVVFDLDPAPDVRWKRVVEAAFNTRAVLEECGLQSWVKTTGGKGLHVVVPLQRRGNWPDVYDFARLITAALMMRYPNEFTDVTSKVKRTNRIFIDYLRNSRGATAIAPWSTRARDGAPVAMPVSWQELRSLTSSDAFRLPDALTRAAQLAQDPWEPMLKSRQQLSSKVMERLMHL